MSLSSILRRRLLLLVPSALIVGGGLWAWLGRTPTLDDDQMATLYAQPRTPPEGPLSVFHLGHSLVGRDMPAMLEQLAGAGHSHSSQLGWGTPLRSHWEPEVEIAGFDTENAHPNYRNAAEALASGEYDALVLTEMVEIRDAIRYHNSAEYLARWIDRARAGRPEIAVYLYETWHRLDDADGWLDRLDADLDRYWEGALLRPALGGAETSDPVHIIPGGQVMAAFVRRIEGGDAPPDLPDRTALFKRTPEGELDQIHINDHGAYLIALTHYATLYARDPRGLPHRLMRADGTPMAEISPEAAALMQEVVWEVVTSTPLTGVTG